MNKLLELVIKRASEFADLDDKLSQEMLKTAISFSEIDIVKLLELNDYDFKCDISGLFSNFDFETKQLLNGFIPLSSF